MRLARRSRSHDRVRDRAGLAQIRALLERLQLPLAGVHEHLPTILVAREGGGIVGTAGLELYADGACYGPSLLTQAAKASSLGIS